jgi:hypothetical protein
MSMNPKERRSHTAEISNKRTDRKIDLSVFEKIGEKISNNNSLVNVSNSNNPNNSVVFNSDSVFKKRIDKLNIKFYFESEKYLNNKSETERCQDQLYVILFKQISLYIEEIEKLSNLLKEKIEDEKILKEKLDEISKNEKDKNSSFIQLKNLKSEINEMQKKIEEKNKNEERLKRENEILKKNLKISEEKIQRNDIATKNCLNESSIVIQANKKKIQNYNGDSFRKNQNSAASTKSNTAEVVIKKLGVDDFLTINSSGKNYFEEDSYATNYNLRNSVISIEDDNTIKAVGPINNSDLTNQGKNVQSIIQTINSNNNQNIFNNYATANAISITNSLEKKALVSINSGNLISPKANNLANIYGNKNIFSFKKSVIGSVGNISNSNTNNINNNISNANIPNTNQMTNMNINSAFSNNLHSNTQTKDLKIIKSIKQKNKASKNLF